MNEALQPPAAPPPGAKPLGKSHFKLIAGGIGVISLLYLMGAFGHGSTPSSSATDSASVASAGGNPIVGQWTLLDTAEAAYCQTYQEFKSNGSATDVRAGVTSSHPAKAIIYDVKPTYVLVSYGGPNYETWQVNGPDDLTLMLTSPYRVTSCRYHRK